MDGERAWERRAVKYAALADPARSHIAELLTVGDRSPKELQEALELPSNLVAHHLNVMTDAGLVTRRRSEADRRRSYVSLTQDAFKGLVPDAGPAPRRVIFVCNANSARSQMAAAIWPLYSSIPASSAGTHPADHIEPGAIKAARRRGFDVPDIAPRALQELRGDEDFIVTVCDSAREELADRADAHWSIPDPVRANTPDAFDSALDAIVRRVADLAPRFTAA